MFQSWNSAKLNCCEYPNKWTNFLAPQTSGISIFQNKIFVPLWLSLLLLSQLNRPQLRIADFTPLSMKIHIFYFYLFLFVYCLRQNAWTKSFPGVGFDIIDNIVIGHNVMDIFDKIMRIWLKQLYIKRHIYKLNEIEKNWRNNPNGIETIEEITEM